MGASVTSKDSPFSLVTHRRSGNVFIPIPSEVADYLESSLQRADLNGIVSQRKIERLTCFFLALAQPEISGRNEARASVELSGIVDGTPRRGITFSDPSRLTPDLLKIITGVGVEQAVMICAFAQNAK